MTRNMAIKWLKWIQNMFTEDSEQYKALQLGIDSMEVDEAYQLEYESTTRNCFGCKYSKDNHNAGTEECHLCMWKNQYTPTTKNDIPHCQCTDEEIAKSFIEDVEAVKDQLPTTKNCKSCRYYGSHHEVCNYCYKCSLWTEQEPTTKNYLALLEKTYDDFCKCEGGEGWLKIDGKEYGTDAGYAIEGVDIFMEVFKRRLAELPSVTPQLSSELEKNSQKLEKNFGELDCISRQAVLDLIADYDLSMGQVVRGIHALPSVTLQEPKIVPIAEIKYDKDKLKELMNKAVLTVTPQEPRWIPCSEKKPNKGGEYLLWGKICDDDEEEYCFLGDYYEFEETFGIEKSNYDPHTLGFLDTEIEEYYSVVAWMPLPKPYEPQESEEV